MGNIRDLAPAQILCFVCLEKDSNPSQTEQSCCYAIVRSFEGPVKPLSPSRIVFEGCLTAEDQFHLYPCNSIHDALAMIPNVIPRFIHDRGKSWNDMENRVMVVEKKPGMPWKVMQW